MQEKAPTEGERRAARLLSLSNNSTLDTVKDPYDQAVGCIVALDLLKERLQGAMATTAKQRQAFAYARQMFETKAAGARSVTPAALQAEIARRRDAVEDENLEVRRASACVGTLVR